MASSSGFYCSAPEMLPLCWVYSTFSRWQFPGLLLRVRARGRRCHRRLRQSQMSEGSRPPDQRPNPQGEVPTTATTMPSNTHDDETRPTTNADASASLFDGNRSFVPPDVSLFRGKTQMDSRKPTFWQQNAATITLYDHERRIPLGCCRCCCLRMCVVRIVGSAPVIMRGEGP